MKSGDTLASIAANFKMDFNTLARYNGITNANQISAGQILEIPLDENGNLVGQDPNQIQFSNSRHLFGFSKKGDHSLLRWPVSSKQARLSSKFGWRWSKFHEGIDIAAPTGVPIYAAHSGRVVMSGYQIRGYGKMLIIQQDNFLTVYAHTNRTYVDAGQNVSVGQHIADVGSTGHATGPHLHFELRFRNKDRKFVAVDPRQYLP